MKRAITVIAALALASVCTSESGIDYGSWLNATMATDAGPSPSCVNDIENCPRKWTYNDGGSTIHIWCAPGSKGWAYFKLPFFGGQWHLFCCPSGKQGQYRYVYDKPGGAVISTETRCK